MTTWAAHFESSGPTRGVDPPSVPTGCLSAPAQEPWLYKDTYIPVLARTGKLGNTFVSVSLCLRFWKIQANIASNLRNKEMINSEN